jgi:hypothetical protein
VKIPHQEKNVMKSILPVVFFAVICCTVPASAQSGSPAPGKTEASKVAPPPATVTGSGTANYYPVWTGASTLGNGHIFQVGSKIGIHTTSPAVELDVNGTANVSKTYQIGGTNVLGLPGCCTDNTAVGVQALQNVNTSGRENTAMGYFALQSDTNGSNNTAIGMQAMQTTVSGGGNTAVGYAALYSENGDSNTAIGGFSLSGATTGYFNTASGFDSLGSTTTGGSNTAHGAYALNANTSGSYNIAIGYQAALNVSGANSSNIHIGNTGVSTDSHVIRIGATAGIIAQTSFFAAGIAGVTTGSNNAVPVVIDSYGQLGTISSSRRFKEDIHDMGEASRGLMQLRPVTFRYQKAFDDGSKPVQYGLIAEEVEEVYPDLVARSADGQVQTVKYQVLDSMLLNEVQRQQQEISELKERLAKLEAAQAR